MYFKLHHGDCLEVLKGMDSDSIDSIVTDPPYGLSFMGKHWDYDVPSVDIWRECLRVLKPGGHLLAFAGTRTQHRMCVNIEDAGFEIRDMIAWVYGSGFPKSLDVSKAIDKARTEDVEPIRGVCRAVRAAMDAKGLKSRDLTQHFGDCHPRLIDHWAARDTDSQPSLPTWEQWEQLREVLDLGEAHDAEVWRLNGRKGQPGDTWQNAEIVGTRKSGDPRAWYQQAERGEGVVEIRAASDVAKQWQGWGTALKPALEPITVARKPLIGTVAENVLAHGTGAINVDGCRVGDDVLPAITAGQAKIGTFERGVMVTPERTGRWPANLIHDGSDEVTGLLDGASRFFYCAKASKRDRDEGLDDMELKEAGIKNDSGRGFSETDPMRKIMRKNNHPTVKPTDLMRYLCRLVTRPGGTVLDPFAGSGSTGKAAILEGFGFVGIEREMDYIGIARARIAAVGGLDLAAVEDLI